MASIKTRNHHICDILYNIYEDNIFQNKKEIKFVSIADPSFMKGTEKLGHCMEIIDAEVKPYQIETLKKQLDKADLNFFCHDIDEKWLITLLEYQNIKRDTKKRHTRTI